MRDDHALKEVVVAIESGGWHIPANCAVQSDGAIEFLGFGPERLA
jgi:hypothetical protein